MQIQEARPFPGRALGEQLSRSPSLAADLYADARGMKSHTWPVSVDVNVVAVTLLHIQVSRFFFLDDDFIPIKVPIPFDDGCIFRLHDSSRRDAESKSVQGLLFFSTGTLGWQRLNNVGVPLLFYAGVQRI